MDGWNFLDGPSEPRNELRCWSQKEKDAEEVTVSIRERIDRIRRIIVSALRDFPDAYRAVIERLELAEARGET